MGTTEWAALHAIAARQHGVVSVEQGLTVGIGRRQLRRAANDGTMRQMHTRVFRFVATKESPLVLCQAAVLQVPESSTSHKASFVHHRIDRVPFVVAVTAPPSSTSCFPGIRVHRSDLIDEHRTTIDGIPTTTLARALVDVSSVFSFSRLEYLVDRTTITERTTSVGAIARVLRQVSGSGRQNIGNLHRILDARQPQEPAVRSRVERRIDQLILGTALPTPIAEYPLPSLDPGNAFVDRAWAEVKLILEVDGRSWHARERAMANDRARDRAAAAEGWQTIRVLDEEVRDLPEPVIADVLAVYRRRRSQLAA